MLQNYIKEIFLDSDTKVACISGAPSEVPEDWCLRAAGIEPGAGKSEVGPRALLQAEQVAVVRQRRRAVLGGDGEMVHGVDQGLRPIVKLGSLVQKHKLGNFSIKSRR